MIEYTILKNNEEFANGLTEFIDESEALEEWLDSNEYEYHEINQNNKGNWFVIVDGDTFELVVG
jgi:hypothetical protein